MHTNSRLSTDERLTQKVCDREADKTASTRAPIEAVAREALPLLPSQRLLLLSLVTEQLLQWWAGLLESQDKMQVSERLRAQLQTISALTGHSSPCKWHRFLCGENDVEITL